MKLSAPDISAILDIRPPFLMIDSFAQVEVGVRGHGHRELSAGDWFFDCHLPGEQVMPATLQVEAMLQTLVLLIYLNHDHGAHRAFVTRMEARAIAPVRPGDCLLLDAELQRFRRGIADGQVTGFVGNHAVCQGTFRYASPHLLPTPAVPAPR